jgi:hypothetical protein
MAIRTSSFCRIVTILAATVLSASGLFAQESRSTIQGLVLDGGGAAVPGASVQVTNEDTNVVASTKSDSQGSFAVPFLSPGMYKLVATAAGFKAYTRSGVELRMADRLQLDIKLEIGDASQQITVTAEVGTLDTASANLGQIIDARSAAELPTYDGSAFSLVYLSSEIVYTYPGAPGSFPQGQQNAITQSNFSGTPRGSTEFTLDGVPNTQNGFADYGSGVMFSPPSDVVQEFKLETPFDASAGHTSGTIVNFVMKGGTNKLRGTALFVDREASMVANSWFSNRAGTPRPAFKYHRWSATATGPVEIPKLYHGTNRTFFTFAYEGVRTIDPSTAYIQSVPTLPQLKGDFSALLGVSAQYQIYDPATITPAPNGRYTRSPFPGNIIPTSRINPVGQNLLNHFPKPNLTTAAVDGTFNWGSFDNGAPRTFSNTIARVDHSFSEKQRLSVRVAYAPRQDGPYRKYWDDPANGQTWIGHAKQFAADDMIVISPSLVFDIRYGMNRYEGSHTPLFDGYDAANLGFSPAVAAQLNTVKKYIPQTSITAIGVQLGDETPDIYNAINHSLIAAFTKNARSHNLKWGADVRAYQNNIYLPGRASGRFSFGTNYTQGPIDNSPSSPSGVGQAVAAALLGLPTSGFVDRNDNQAGTSKYLALYIHDNWRATRKLTLDFGIRWEFDSGETERYNRAVRGFDPTAQLSITSRALAAYAARPEAGIPVGQFKVLGGLQFAGVNGQPRGFWDPSYKVFAPRFGAAYTIDNKTVARLGFGVFPLQKGITAKNVAIQSGYNQQTPLVPTLDNGQTFIGTLTNPFPTGILNASGSSLGPNTFLGQAISVYNPQPRTPYQMFLSVSLQRQLPGNTVLETAFVANKAIRLPLNHDINGLPNNYLSSAYRDNTTINYNSQAIANPFAGLLPGTSFNGATIARQLLLRPFPQFTSVTLNDYQGASWYNALRVNVRKRLSKSITLQANYSFAKLIEAMQYLNAGDAAPSRYISPIDRPHNAVFSGIFELPVGRGRKFFSGMGRVTDGFLGGWQVGAIYRFTSGAPLNWGNVILTGDLQDVSLPNDQRSVNRWINTAVFNTVAVQQPSSNLRRISPYFGGIRSGWVNNWDLNLVKNVRFRERFTVQVRLDAMNALNHPNAWAPPSTTPTDAAFGRVTGMYSNPRQVQMQAKLMF